MFGQNKIIEIMIEQNKIIEIMFKQKKNNNNNLNNVWPK